MSSEVSTTLELLDKDNQRGLWNIMPREARAGLEKVAPEYFYYDESQLEKLIKPSSFVNRLRFAFWNEYERAQSTIRPMSIHNIAIHMGVPSTTVSAHLKIPNNIMWVVQPPPSYDTFLDEALDHGLRRLRNDILTMNINSPSGDVDVKKADLLLKAVAFIDMRKHGGIVQKTLNVHSNTNDFKKITETMTMKDIDEKIKELEQQGVIKKAVARVIDGE